MEVCWCRSRQMLGLSWTWAFSGCSSFGDCWTQNLDICGWIWIQGVGQTCIWKLVGGIHQYLPSVPLQHSSASPHSPLPSDSVVHSPTTSPTMLPNIVVVIGKGDDRISTPEQVVILLPTSGLGKGANWCVAYLRNHTFPIQTQGYCSGDITVDLNILCRLLAYGYSRDCNNAYCLFPQNLNALLQLCVMIFVT